MSVYFDVKTEMLHCVHKATIPYDEIGKFVDSVKRLRNITKITVYIGYHKEFNVEKD